VAQAGTVIAMLELSAVRRQPRAKELREQAHWLIVVPLVESAADWPAIPWRELLVARAGQRGFELEKPAAMATELPDEAGTRVLLATAGAHSGAFERLGWARARIKTLADARAERAGVVIAGFAAEAADRIAEALVAAAAAAAAAMPSFRSEPNPAPPLQGLALYGANPRHGFRRTLAEAEGNVLARELAMLPPNELTPGAYRARVQSLAREHGWQMRFHGLRQLERKGAGAFLAVAQASARSDAGIVHLRCDAGARSSKAKRVALVGKGICYDTGGVNLKPARYMLGMHEDMAGSAVALGTLLALSRLQPNLRVDAWLALAQNDVGPRAYKPGDVLKALDGTSIEAIHTDAEGRMVLADTLVMASRTKPDLIIDYATLTGSCVAALGKAYSGAFTNREAFIPLLIEAGRASGERVWPFPQDADYDKGLESAIADVKQCAEEGAADHILAARFLQRFVKHEVPWIHLDLASANHKGGLAHVPTDSTGFGVRYTLNLLLEQKLLR